MAAGEAFALYKILRSSYWDICSVNVALPGKYAISLLRCPRWDGVRGRETKKLELRSWCECRGRGAFFCGDAGEGEVRSGGDCGLPGRCGNFGLQHLCQPPIL